MQLLRAAELHVLRLKAWSLCNNKNQYLFKLTDIA